MLRTSSFGFNVKNLLIKLFEMFDEQIFIFFVIKGWLKILTIECEFS